jgi:hypothetical protein
MTFGIIIGSHSAISSRRERPKGLARGSSAIDRHVSANFYPTPREATLALLSAETFDGSVWEPACGMGHISTVLKDCGHDVVSTDLNDWGYGLTGINFLDETRPRARHIITNPPYGSGLADAFVAKALSLTRSTKGKVAMLLNLASLSHVERTAFWRAHPPARLYAMDDIVCWPDPDRPPPRHFTQQRYIWAVWTPDHKGPPAFWWLSAADFRMPQSFPNRNSQRRFS